MTQTVVEERERVGKPSLGTPTTSTAEAKVQNPGTTNTTVNSTPTTPTVAMAVHAELQRIRVAVAERGIITKPTKATMPRLHASRPNHMKANPDLETGAESEAPTSRMPITTLP
jgi:hypothetical protein